MKLSKFKKLYAFTSRKHFVNYLKDNGISIGKNVHFVKPSHTHIDTNRGLYISIGDNCIICHGVSMIAHDFSWTIAMKAFGCICPSGGGTISIGNNCFIGQNATILRNVSIGNNVIVAAGSIVTKDIPSNCVCGGNPANVIMTLEEYMQKRMGTSLTEAQSNARYIYQKTGRYPTQAEMRNFIYLFMPRTDENIQKYVKNYGIIGWDQDKYIHLLKLTAPMYADFDAFIKDTIRIEN